jgi:ABC-2 type transport system permease protein
VSAERLASSGLAGLAWLSRREVLRVWKLWTQTVLAPVVSSMLFIVVFGLSLGRRIDQIAGFPYQTYIVPGLIAMAMVQAAYNNNSSSVFQARSDRYIHDVLSAPMHPWQVNLGFTVGGVARAVAIGAGLMALAVPLTWVGVEEPLVLLAGTIVGIFAETFDHNTFISNIVILPLAFLGGVFYSVDSLPSPWQELTHVNPLFYVVDAMRFGVLGVSDASPWLSLGVTAALAVPTYGWAQWLFTSGRRLKPRAPRRPRSPRPRR